MRISDWSSDVCSSDLHAKAEAGDVGGHRLAVALRRVARRHMADLVAQHAGHLSLVLGKGEQAAGDVDVAARQREGIHHRGVENGEGEIQVRALRSEEHTSELQSLMRISYAVLFLNKKQSTAHSSSHGPRPSTHKQI